MRAEIQVVINRDLVMIKLCPKSHIGVKVLPQMALQGSLGREVNLSLEIINITTVQYWSTQQF